MEQLELLGIDTENHGDEKQFYIGLSRFTPYFRLHEEYLMNNEVEILFTNHLGNDFVIGLQREQFESLVKQFNNELERIKNVKTLNDEIINGTFL